MESQDTLISYINAGKYDHALEMIEFDKFPTVNGLIYRLEINYLLRKDSTCLNLLKTLYEVELDNMQRTYATNFKKLLAIQSQRNYSAIVEPKKEISTDLQLHSFYTDLKILLSQEELGEVIDTVKNTTINIQSISRKYLLVKIKILYGVSARLLGRRSIAQECFSEAMHLSEQLENTHLAALVLFHSSELLEDILQLDDALRLVKEGKTLIEDYDNKGQQIKFIQKLTNLLYRTNNYDTAKEYFYERWIDYNRNGSPDPRLRPSLFLMRISIRQADIEQFKKYVKTLQDKKVLQDTEGMLQLHIREFISIYSDKLNDKLKLDANDHNYNNNKPLFSYLINIEQEVLKFGEKHGNWNLLTDSIVEIARLESLGNRPGWEQFLRYLLTITSLSQNKTNQCIKDVEKILTELESIGLDNVSNRIQDHFQQYTKPYINNKSSDMEDLFIRSIIPFLDYLLEI